MVFRFDKYEDGGPLEGYESLILQGLDHRVKKGRVDKVVRGEPVIGLLVRSDDKGGENVMNRLTLKNRSFFHVEVEEFQ